ncbi:MAG: YraN family protein [Anaerocolumna sp.]
MYNKRAVGAKQEQVAADYLRENGYLILESNFRCRTGEIDVIAKDDGYLVFVEVKYRKNTAKGLPQEAVDLHKRQKITRTAQFYILRNHIPADIPCRFDVVTILGQEISIIQNAFDSVYG